jgi:protein TonB
MRHIDPLRGAVMFEESLLESAHLIRPQSRWTTAASFAIQASIAALIITIPLLHPQAITLHRAELTLTPPPHDPPKPPPAQPVHVEAATASGPTTPTQQQSLPPQIPRGHLDPTGFSNDPLPEGTNINMASNNNPLASIGPTTTGPAIAVTPAARPGPLNISKGVAVGLLLAPITPVYPPIAKAAHQEGIVIIHAIISKTGRIESATAESGPMMLRQSALEAVTAARYRPYLLNGSPTEVETTFNINFRLSQ